MTWKLQALRQRRIRAAERLAEIDALLAAEQERAAAAAERRAREERERAERLAELERQRAIAAQAAQAKREAAEAARRERANQREQAKRERARQRRREAQAVAQAERRALVEQCRPAIEAAAALVGDLYGTPITPQSIRARRRGTAKVDTARYIVAWYARHHLRLGYRQIGVVLGGRTEAGICQRLARPMSMELAALARELTLRLRAPAPASGARETGRLAP